MLVPKSNFDDILSDVEKEKVGNFLEDEETVEAVKKIILYTIYSNGTLKKGQKAYNPEENFLLSFAVRQDLDRERKGEIAEAMVAGITSVKLGFDALKSFKKVKKEDFKQKNPAK